MFKYDPETGKAFQFESISAEWMSEEKLISFLSRISKATNEQLKKIEY